MDRTLSWIRENPQFAAVVCGGIIVALVLGLLAMMMARAGASLRPIIWFAGFFAIIAGPQVAVHVLDGFVVARARASASAPTSASAPAPAEAPSRLELAPVPWTEVFGPNADPALITDAKRGLGAILGTAQEAKLSFNTAGESALAARFSSAAEAAAAVPRYANFFAFAQVRGSADGGLTARRHGGQGEWVHVVAAGPELYAWTGATREAVLARRGAALGPVAENGGDVAEGTSAAARPVSRRLASRPAVIFTLVALNLVAAVGWFFKGSAWAARVTPVPSARPAPAESLERDLLALNRPSQPVVVTRTSEGTLEVNWPYADARWWDVMRVHQLKRAHRLVLTLDETSHTVRVREYWSAFDTAAGAGEVRLRWTLQTGIQFFAVEKQRVLGAQLAPSGRSTGDLSHAYTFDLHALKAPVREAVTRSGWTWQPVTWNAPASWRWLTE